VTTSSTARERTSFVGMAVFLGGWTMLFVALLFVWADVRLTAHAWPPDGEPRAPLLYPAIATLLIAASSWLLARGRVAATVICGVGFVAVQLLGLAALWRTGVTPSSGRYGSILYTFLALHGLHVVVGLAGLSLARATQRNWRAFWHFVGVVWLVLFAVLFLAGCSQEARGRATYQQYCRPCHGDNGDGHGVSAAGLRPPPRDFTQAMFKFGHVEIPQLPPDDELKHIIKRGLNGTAMHPWDLSERELDDVVQYIKTFSPRWRTDKIGEAIVPSADPFGPTREKEAIAHGEAKFHDLCANCHERRELKTTEYCLRGTPEDCKLPVRELPPDLRCDPLRTIHPGSELTDLYRVIAAGIGGASMPTWKGRLPEQDLWGVAYYVRSLRADQTGCSVSRTGQ
jgi:heme/copper-type cytochrome/quinol oxidase subunit 3/mono/diheme cytochrome c family protein